jgi:hypothetical protein
MLGFFARRRSYGNFATSVNRYSGAKSFMLQSWRSLSVRVPGHNSQLPFLPCPKSGNPPTRSLFISSRATRRSILVILGFGTGCLVGAAVGNSFKQHTPSTHARTFVVVCQTVSIVAIAAGSAIILWQPIRSTPVGTAMKGSLQRLVFRWSYGGVPEFATMLLNSWPMRGLWHHVQVSATCANAIPPSTHPLPR